jgi:acylphosphatase
MVQTIRITVSGRVQGVYYRQSAKEKATALNITGTIQNNPDKTVTIVATGSEESLSLLRDWCRKGPARAVVSGVGVSALPLTDFAGFCILR